MSQDELTRIIQISVVGALAVGLVYVYVQKLSLLSFSALGGFSTGLSVVTLFWVFYFRWGWRWPILSKLFNKPDLNGTWLGTLTSDWKDPNGRGVEPKDFVIVVRQSFLYLHFVTFTDSFIAFSYAERFWTDAERGIKKVVYLYGQDCTTLGEEGNREGATELRVEGEPPLCLIGRYWSNTKTNGRIEVRRISKKHVDSFAEAIATKRRK
ncbi:hypothetical protein H6G04_29250 [Calothrix membranacea FACHB-236]|nr:hypothetical protein [Calothrix membranacea FACHB-236]